MQELIKKYGKEWYKDNQRRVLLYRNFEVYTDDFEFVHISYDGAPDADDARWGWGQNKSDALDQIDAMYIDLDLDWEGNYKKKND